VGARIWIPLRVLLPCLAVGVVALGAVVVGAADVSAVRGDLIRQADTGLLACANGVLSHPFAAATFGPVSGQLPPGACDIELLSASGQLLTPPAPGTGPGPALPADGSWLTAHVARPVTVPGAGSSGRWRVVLEAVHYQPQRMLFVYGPDNLRYLISGRAGHGLGGLLVVMAGVAGVGRTADRVAVAYAIAAGVALVLLAVAGLTLARLIMRPLREAAGFAGLAGPAADEELPRAISRQAIDAEQERSRRPFAPALMRISEQLRASRAAEAAARRSAEELSGRLAEVSLALRTSVNVVAGFAEYYRQRGRSRPAGPDPVMRRVADEVARMETLIAQLDTTSPAGSPRRGDVGIPDD